MAVSITSTATQTPLSGTSPLSQCCTHSRGWPARVRRPVHPAVTTLMQPSSLSLPPPPHPPLPPLPTHLFLPLSTHLSLPLPTHLSPPSDLGTRWCVRSSQGRRCPATTSPTLPCQALLRHRHLAAEVHTHPRLREYTLLPIAMGNPLYPRTFQKDMVSYVCH